jgi:dTDP-glucose 4,6-dehydratase
MKLPQSGNVLVLASNSFTGSHFVDHVLSTTDLHVVGVSRSSEYHPNFLPYRFGKEPAAGRFHFYQMDVNQDMAALIQLCDILRPAVVANFSAQGEVRNSWKHPEQWWQTNTMSVVHLTEALRQRDYLQSYVTSSTPEVYGCTGLNVHESHTYRPSTPYAASKLGGDLHLATLVHRYNFPAVFTRAANVYGRHQQLYRIIPRTVISILLGRTIELHGRGLTQRAFVHVRDVADATWKAVLHGKPGDVFHVSPDGELRTIASVVEMICRRMNVEFTKQVRLVDENFGQDGVFSLNSARARVQLGWLPRISFEQGVDETVDWITSNWSFIKEQPHEYIHKI